MRCLPFLFVVIACNNSVEKNEFQPPSTMKPGGGSVLNPYGPDSGAPNNQIDAGAVLSGQLCPITDLRFPSACPVANNFDGMTIQIGSQTVNSNSDGVFEVSPPQGDTFLVRVSDNSNRYISSMITLSGAEEMIRVPVVSTSHWDTLLTTLGTVAPDSNARLALVISTESGRASDVEITPPIGSATLPYYDMGGANSWISGGGTNQDGSALLFTVPVFSNTTSFQATKDGQITTISNIPIAEDVLTFASILLTE